MSSNPAKALLCLIVVPFLSTTDCGAAVRSTTSPNIIVFLSDDQGWGDLSLNGNENLSTPNIDQLAKEGTQFDRFFVCPVCSPTRAEFLTGRYHPRGGVYGVSTGGERLNLDEVTIADTLKAAGYATAAFGKWHNGMQYPYHPLGRGFQEFYGFCSGHWGQYFTPMLDHNGEIVTGEGFCIDDFTNHAIRFIEENQDEPFFVYLPYNTPHSPMQVPDSWWNRFADKEITSRHRDPDKEDVVFTRAALAMCENIDWNVGRVLQTLDRLQLTNDTIVLYFCDNGPNSFRWNGGMKGRKGSTDEGGVRSPLIIRWPGKIAAGRKAEPIAAAIDLLPTIADLASVPLISTKPLDGVSLKPLLAPEAIPNEWPDRTLISHWGKRVAARNQRFRLDDAGHLFDMSIDPGQYSNLAEQHPEITEELKDAVRRYRNEVMPGYDKDSRPFLIAHPDFAITQLPARDAVTVGGMTRSSRHPNCSYFSNWCSTEDAIHWKVDVVEEGEFEVGIYYTCAAPDVGATIQLRFRDAMLEGIVSDPVESALIGGSDDRVERGEGYVKNFGRMTLGRMHLPKGTGTLTLSATDIPGSQVMDFRLLTLRRISAEP
ncbi:MAG: arylsulfatase [Planctomycetaceae bacterium]|nr:arylsulfatase [Planctomycetaceae bacterium]